MDNETCRAARALCQEFLSCGGLAASNIRVYDQPSALRLLRAVGIVRPYPPDNSHYGFTSSLLHDVLASWYYPKLTHSPSHPLPVTLPELLLRALPLFSRGSLFHDEAANRQSFSEYQAQGELHVAVRELLGKDRIVLRESKVVSHSDKKLDISILNGQRHYIEVTHALRKTWHALAVHTCHAQWLTWSMCAAAVFLLCVCVDEGE